MNLRNERMNEQLAYHVVVQCINWPLGSKLFSLAVQGSGALLSSNLEGALYESP